MYLRNRFIPFIFFISMLAVACTKDASVQPEEPGTDEPGTVVVIGNNVNKDTLLALVNEVRAKGCTCGGTAMPPVTPLAWDLRLELAAANHSKDMQDRKYFSHTSPNGSTPKARVQAAGYSYIWMGENIASGPKTEADVIKGWLGSPDHCKNIMGAQFKEMGVARAGTYWTQVLGAESNK